jgi:hypothetical protein
MGPDRDMVSYYPSTNSAFMIGHTALGRILIAIGVAIVSAGCYSMAVHVSEDLSIDLDAQDDQGEPLPEICPEPQGLQVSFSVQELDEAREEIDLELKCLVASVTNEGTTRSTVALDCAWEDEFDRRLTLTLFSTAGFSLFIREREMVVLKYAMEIPWWTNRWFALRESGEYVPGPIIAAGVDASSVAPFGINMRESSWYSPLYLMPLAGLCDVQTVDCYDVERIAIGVSDVFHDDPSEIVYDNSTGILFLGDETAGSLYPVHVMTAENRSNFRCTDISSVWFSALVFAVPGD